MTEPGIYHGMSMADYQAIEAIGQQTLQQTLDRCPLAGWFNSYLNPHRPADDTAPKDAGSIAHKILLEGTMDGVCVIDPNDHPTEKTGNIPDGWTNKSIRAARDAARDAGQIPILKPAMGEIKAMVTSAEKFIQSLRVSEPAIFSLFQPNGGTSETTIVWKDEGVLCRIRPDRLSADHALIGDAKFTGTSAEPDQWGRTQMVRMGYYTAAAFYQRGVEQLTGKTCSYVYLVVETAPPYLCSLVGVDPHAFSLGHEKINLALAKWRKCVKDGYWPGYPTRVAYPEIPAWEDARWLEQQTSEPIAYGSQG